MSIFDEMAARYDTPQRTQVADAIASALRPHLAGCTQKSAIDYGCGTGLVGLQLAGCFKSLLMVDASPQMVEVVQGKIERAHLKNAHTLCADFSNGAPAGLFADVVFMAQVLLHIPNTGGILRRLYAALNPGGRLLVVDFDKAESVPSDKVHNGFVQSALTALARQAGFATAQAGTFYHGEQIFMGQDASLFLMQAAKGEAPPA